MAGSEQDAVVMNACPDLFGTEAAPRRDGPPRRAGTGRRRAARPAPGSRTLTDGPTGDDIEEAVRACNKNIPDWKMEGSVDLARLALDLQRCRPWAEARDEGVLGPLGAWTLWRDGGLPQLAWDGHARRSRVARRVPLAVETAAGFSPPVACVRGAWVGLGAPMLVGLDMRRRLLGASGRCEELRRQLSGRQP